MKKAFVFLAAALLSISASLSAQEKDEVLFGGPKDNWFIGVGGGVNFVFDAMKLNKPAAAAQLNVGKWFSPAVGARVGYTGVMANSPKVTTNWFSADPTKPFYNHFVHGDLMWSLRNTYSYKENLVWNPILYLQAGGYFAHQAKSHAWAFGLGGGFQNLFRVSKCLNISVDLSAVLAPEKPFRQNTGRFLIFPTATAGLVFDLGKGFQRPEKVEVPDPEIIDKLQAKLANANDDLAAAQNRAAALAKKAAKLDKLQEGKLYEFVSGNLNEAEATVAAAATPEILYFELGKTKLDPRELARLEYYAQKTFNVNQKLVITGGADLGTGSLETNKRLSKQRAEYVKNILVKQFGYKDANITTEADVIPSDSPIKGRIVTIEVVK